MFCIYCAGERKTLGMKLLLPTRAKSGERNTPRTRVKVLADEWTDSEADRETER